MRMRFRNVRGEEGAVLIIVAMSLIAVFGISALVMDVGALLVTRRRMVRAADSAALAAAQSCATNQAPAAETEADEYALANSASNNPIPVSSTNIIDQDGCGTSSGFVVVEYKIERSFYFGSLLGIGDGAIVPGRAKAIWGPAGSGNLPPLMVSGSAFQGDCDIPGTAEAGAECNFWYSKDDLGSSTWGWLNLYTEDNPGPGGAVGWDVEGDATCPNVSADQRNDWLGKPVAVPALNSPDPTYVCIVTGLTDTNWETLRKLAGKELQFPVNDPDTQVDKDGNVVADKPDKYNIIGFVTLKIIGVYDGHTSEAVGSEGTSYTTPCENQPAPQPHTFKETPAEDAQWDVSTYVNSCAADHPGDAITIKVQPNKYKDPPHSQADYSFSNGVITWLKFPKSGEVNDAAFTLYYSGTTAGTSGFCGSGGKAPNGVDDGKLQDKCLVTEWVGFNTDGGDPGQGADLGNRPVRLDRLDG